MRYRIIGIKVNEFSRLVKCELYRETFEGARICKHNMLAHGYVAAIKPTPEVWCETLEAAHVHALQSLRKSGCAKFAAKLGWSVSEKPDV